MRKINDLTSWEDFEKKLLKRKGYKELAELENMESSPTISLLERISIALGSKLYISFQA
ncbi:MAG: hypothetical protein UR68_C0014G0004 [Candidatus Roizmanbacteria bacterium GW2011_GWA2_35_19]|uniref:HTH cro/C1-type domain-containing protein n=1 Tax=Candidatus Roizmanbacteria bacterium GW2011_GWA2_35_19 TaxID=1618478 RepID=A0A0G0BSQ9_9BACT|nr:MAG: hypothetical protein UR68_C0014G0004 [Candidatus Roizmanbacteria bacterium GW2011_GWA2_35_19]